MIDFPDAVFGAQFNIAEINFKGAEIILNQGVQITLSRQNNSHIH